MSSGRVRRRGREADGAGFARRRCACVASDSECVRGRSACVADDPECARESSVCRAYRVGSRPVEREMALLDLIGRGFSYSISKTPSTRINANSVTWCFIREKPALLGKTEIEYEKAQRCGRAGECAGLVIGLVVELGVMTDWDGDADSYRPSSAIICFMARAHSSCCDMNSGHAFSLPLILHPLL